jgi:GDP-4-dehydro-6-deoxy-D-mannose reductase
MTTLVTGAGGFVGSFIRKLLPSIPLEDEFGFIDLREEDRLFSAITKFKLQSVIHLAAQSFVPVSFKEPQVTFDINFKGTFNLLTALKQAGFTGRMIFVSSGDTYGLIQSADLPLHEEHPLRPRNPYAVSKVAAEALCYQWSQTESFEIISVRPFNHIGPGQNESFVVSDFARQIIEIKLGMNEPVINVGDIEATRDFTDVRDIVRAYKLLLEFGKNGEAYNVCSGEERTIRSLLDIMLYLSQVDAEIKQDSARMRPSEQRRVMGDFSKLHKDTGWSPEISLEQTLMDILNYWEKMLS